METHIRHGVSSPSLTRNSINRNLRFFVSPACNADASAHEFFLYTPCGTYKEHIVYMLMSSVFWFRVVWGQRHVLEEETAHD